MIGATAREKGRQGIQRDKEDKGYKETKRIKSCRSPVESARCHSNPRVLRRGVARL